MHEWPALGPLDRGHVALVLPPALGMQNGPGHAHCHCNGLRLILQRSWTCPHATSPEFRARGGSAWVQEQARQHASQAGLTGRHGPGRRPAAGPGRRPVEVNASAWAAECQGRARSSGEVARPASFVEAQTSQPRGVKKIVGPGLEVECGRGIATLLVCNTWFVWKPAPDYPTDGGWVTHSGF